MTAPAAGTHNVVVTAPDATVVTATSMSFTGVNQSTPLGTIATAIGTSTAPAVSATAAVGEGIFDVMGAVGSTTPTVAGATQTVRQTNNTSTGADRVVIGSSTAFGTGSPVSMAWTIPNADWAHAAVPVLAATAQTNVKVSAFVATWQPDRVLVTWRSGYQPSSLGFYVHREDAGGARVRLNGELISGGAVQGASSSLSSFSWEDATPGWDGSVSYWLEDVNVDGSSTWYGPAMAVAGAAPPNGSIDGGDRDVPAAGGCVVMTTPRGGAVQLVLVLALTVGLRRGRRRWPIVALYLVAALGAGLSRPGPASAAGGIAVDASATGTGMSGLTFSHTMGAGANGLLIVGVVVPIVCDTTATDGGNCGVCGTTCPNYTAAGLASGLLGHWRFDEGVGSTSADASGNGNTATLTSGPAWVTGYTGNGLEGNGSSSYLNANLGTWFGADNTLSASAWVYVTANTNGPIFGVTAAPPGGGWNMPFLSIDGTTVYSHLWQVNGNNPLSSTVTANAWHHLAVTYSPGSTPSERFYVDGAQVAQANGAYQASGATDTLTTYISGWKPPGVNSYLNGKLDELRAYDRVLSAAEVSALYTARLSCSAGTCAGCPLGLMACPGTCLDTMTDVNNCGSCGHACNVAGGETCIAGTCGCASGTDCSMVCVDLTTDPNNCNGCGIACGMPTNAGMDTSLVGRWHLDEGSGTTSADSSGNVNTATLASTTWTAGYSSYGLTFNGTSSSLTATLGTAFGSNTALTATAWVYATSTTNGPIFGVAQPPSGSGWNMPFLSINGATVYGWLWQVNGNNPLSATVSLDAWHFLAITYNPATSPSEFFYVDGVLSTSATGTYAPSGVSDILTTYIPGARPAGVNSYLNGKIDELRGYSRALSASEIAILYNARQTCSASTCGGCTGGATSCAGACTSLATDSYNCGTCGTTCNVAGGETCISSSCGCSTGTDCSGTCVDTTTNQSNCGMCGNACGAVTCGSCGNRMAGLWHMSEGSGATSADASGAGHPLTLVNSPTWTTGQSGSGLSFNGTSSYATATLGATFGGNNAVSASAWVYATATTNGPIFGVTQTLPGTNWNMPFLSIDGSTVYGWLWQVNGNNPLSATVSLNAWHMLTITYDPAAGGIERFYVDGVLSSSGTGTYSPSGATDYFTTYISGAKPAGVGSYLNGTIDEVRAYDRLLTAGEITLLYDARQACTASTCSGCPSGMSTCGGVCTNTLYDNNNCNGCGTVCGGGTTCIAGMCL